MTDDLSATPLDSDSSRRTQSSLTRDVFLVFGGGTVGTALRLLASVTIPDADGVPIQIFGINMVGAFALGMLLEVLARQGRDVGRRRTARLLLGTGLIGGFTTFSTLTVGAAELLHGGRPVTGILYALGTVIVGALVTAGGILLAAHTHTARVGGNR